MKLKMITTASGPEGTLQAGHVVDVGDKTFAQALIEGGYAHEIGEQPNPRPTAAEGVENTAAGGAPETGSTRTSKTPAAPKGGRSGGKTAK